MSYKPNYIRLELFPARIESADQTLSERKVIVTDDKVFFYANGSKGPEQEYEADLYDLSGSHREGWTILTGDQKEYRVSRDKGCACGSRLRGHRPFPYTPYRRG